MLGVMKLKTALTLMNITPNTKTKKRLLQMFFVGCYRTF